MYYASQKEILERWKNIPEILKDAINSESLIGEIEKLSSNFGLNEDRLLNLLRIVRGVFLGFIHLQDLYKEIKESLNIDPRLALDIYHQLEQKIFSPFRKEIEEVYLKFQVGAIEPHQVEEPAVGPSQVILKKEEEDLTLNLKPTEAVSKPALEERPEEVKKVEAEEISKKDLAEPKPQIISSETIKPETQIEETKTATQAKEVSQEEKKPSAETQEGPVIIHQEAESLTQSKATDKFRMISFGGFQGAFKNPPFSSKTQELSSQATIETPITLKKEPEEKGKIPVVIKKYDSSPSKTVHISTFKTDLKPKDKEEKESIDQQNPSHPQEPQQTIDLSKL
ncbi:MAG: hypothetical protein KatS3mg098_138 [Candidatus Parcubacteria bacterium]|nr:MAG: hypothetical protein KatS3mg098_138 [Candidatus Parcubacteria bacterium]